MPGPGGKSQTAVRVGPGREAGGTKNAGLRRGPSGRQQTRSIGPCIISGSCTITRGQRFYLQPVFLSCPPRPRPALFRATKKKMRRRRRVPARRTSRCPAARGTLAACEPPWDQSSSGTGIAGVTCNGPRPRPGGGARLLRNRPAGPAKKNWQETASPPSPAANLHTTEAAPPGLKGRPRALIRCPVPIGGCGCGGPWTNMGARYCGVTCPAHTHPGYRSRAKHRFALGGGNRPCAALRDEGPWIHCPRVVLPQAGGR